MYLTNWPPQAVEDLQATAGPETHLRHSLQRFGETVLKVMTDSGRALAVHRMVLAVEAIEAMVGRAVEMFQGGAAGVSPAA